MERQRATARALRRRRQLERRPAARRGGRLRDARAARCGTRRGSGRGTGGLPRGTRPGRRRPPPWPRTPPRCPRSRPSLARDAASRAASGSIARRTSVVSSYSLRSFVASARQLSTSGSRMFQSDLARTRVPIFGLRLDEPLRREDAHGLAQDGPADREIRGELVLRRQRIAGLDGPADDLQADRVHDLAVQPTPRIGEWPRHGRRSRIRGSYGQAGTRWVRVVRSIIIRYAFWASDRRTRGDS